MTSRPETLTVVVNAEGKMIADGWIAGAIAFIIALVAIPLLIIISRRWGLLDPTGPLKIHRQPIPRVGGLALMLALVIGTIVFRVGHPAPVTFYLALAWVGITGFIDDIRGLRPATRLLMQAGAALLLCSAGWQAPLFHVPALNVVTACLFLVASMNAFNFLDGSDGVAAGVTALIALGYLLVPNGTANGNFGSLIAWALLGSCLSFLLFNFPPARIFMGDCGSTTLGLVTAFLGLNFYRAANSSGPQVLLPVMFSGLPFLDLGLAVLRRLRKRVSPFSADRQHFYDLLLTRGMPPRQVVLSCFGVSAAFEAAALLCARSAWPVALLILSLTVGAFLTTAISLGSLRTSELTAIKEPRESSTPGTLLSGGG
jgi:UDP-GlcNAc:undecaprenyl-phosphate GlcNAc-1-phosphate transferase